MPEDTANTASTTGAEPAATPTQIPVTDGNEELTPVVFQDEVPVTADSSQEDVDRVVAEALGEEYVAPTTNDGTEEPAKPVETPAEPETPVTETPAPETPAEETPEETKPVETEAKKGYTPEDAEAAKQKAEELANKEVDVSDLWVELTDADGKVVKIDVTNGVPDDFKFQSDKQLYDLVEAMGEMRNIQKERTNELTAEKDQVNETVKAQEAQQAQVAAWDAEIEELISAGVLTEPTVKMGDPKFNEDPTVKQVVAVFGFMEAENTARDAAGKPRLLSFGTALSLYNQKTAAAAEAARIAQSNQEAKAAGSRVGGSSAAAGQNQDVYKSGSYNSIYDIPV